jgi:GNAT superfamily N-acetyltransferase
MIRSLLPSEVAICCEAGRAFFAEGKLPGEFVAEAFIEHWSTLIQVGSGVILGLFSDKTGEFLGGLGAVVAPDFNSFDKVAAEVFWFVKPEVRGEGLKLLPAYEAWAKEKGAKRCGMVHLLNLQPEILHKVFMRRGYQPIEVNYMKDLAEC